MPSWSVHFAVANEVNKKLKLDRDLFFYGNILPDVNYEFNIDRDKAHYYGIPFDCCPKEEAIDLERFLNDYKDSLNNPLVLGYYCHLITDNYFNKTVYKKCFVLDKDNNIIGIRKKNGNIIKVEIDDKKKIKRKYKHHDFELYGKYLFNKEYLPIDKNKIYDNIKYIKNNYLTKDIVDDRFNYFSDKIFRDNKLSFWEKIFKHRYYLFTKKELDNIFNDCCKIIIDEIAKLK